MVRHVALVALAWCALGGSVRAEMVTASAKKDVVCAAAPRGEVLAEPKTFDVRAFGAREDATPAENAKAIQKAIDSAAGGRVVVPKGTWVSGTIWLKSRVELHLEKGAVLEASPNFADYNAEDAYPENFGCPKDEYWRGLHFIICRCQERVAITGEGEINGNGDVFFEDEPRAYYDWMKPGAECWWNGIRWAKDKKNLRPGQLVVFVKSNDVAVRGVTIRNSPCWSLFFHGCRNVEVADYTVRNGMNDGNTDGVDVDCCQNVTMRNLDVDTGDDAIAIRASGARLGLDPQPACENVRISKAKLRSTSSVFRIGVGQGEIRNVVVEDVQSDRGGTAINMNTLYGPADKYGVDMSDVTFRNCTFDNCRSAYALATAGKALKYGIRNVFFDGVRFTGPDGKPQTRHYWIQGEKPIKNVVIADGEAKVASEDTTAHWDVFGSFGRFAGDAERTADGLSATWNGCRLETKIVRGHAGVTSRKTTLTNASSEPTSARCLLDKFVLEGGDWEIYTQTSCWEQESRGAWQELHTGVEARGDGLRTCDGAAPMLALWNRESGKGRVFHLLTDAQWVLRVVRKPAWPARFNLVVEAGFEPRHLDYRLAPGESVAFPEIVSYEFENKLDLDCHRLHAYWNRRHPAKTFPAIYNTWLARFDKFDLDFLLKQVERAKAIGFDYFVVDAGWFGPAKGWWNVRGDWEENPDGRLKGRLAEVSKAARAAGMKFGFWLEPEAVNDGTAFAKQHADWCLEMDGNTYLDFRIPAAFSNLLERTCALVKKYDASFLKFDFNQSATCDASGRDFADYNAAYRRFVRAVRARNPGIYVEGCASGGYMMDLSWAGDFDSFWLSDNQSAHHSFRIVRDTMLRLPPRMIERWLTLRRADGLQVDAHGANSRLLSTDDAQWLRMRSVSTPFLDALTMGGPFGMSSDLTAFSDEDVEHFRAVVTERRGEGAFWMNAVGRVLADTSHVTALQYSDEALSDVRVVVVPHRPLTHGCTIRPKVDMDAEYLVDGKKRSGRDVADAGIDFMIVDDLPKIVRLRRIGAAENSIAAANPARRTGPGER